MGALAVITIGIDPHKASLTAAQAALHCPRLRGCYVWQGPGVPLWTGAWEQSADAETALPTLAIALPQLLELAAVLRLAGLLFDLLDKLLAPWASRKILDELGD
jgi:hypothetical protein